MKGISVIRDDGLRGTVVDVRGDGLVVDFENGSQSVINPETLIHQEDGTYRLSLSGLETSYFSREEELVIPVIEEEFTVEKQRIERAKVTVNKRVETRDETVYTPTSTEEVVVEHIPINQLIKDKIPRLRKEDGVLIIPIVEEIVVVEKRLLFKEEVRISKRHTTTNVPQTVTLRREVVDVERTELNNIIDSTVEIDNIRETTVETNTQETT